MKEGDTRTSNLNNFSNELGANSSPPSVTIDLVNYVHHLDGLPLSYEQKLTLLNALNEFAWNFIAMGFQVHPVQNGCGQDTGSRRNLPTSGDQTVSLSHHFFDGTKDENSARDELWSGERAD